MICQQFWTQDDKTSNFRSELTDKVSVVGVKHLEQHHEALSRHKRVQARFVGVYIAHVQGLFSTKLV